MEQVDILIIGGGAAGIAAAKACAGDKVLLADRKLPLGAFCSSAPTVASAKTKPARNMPDNCWMDSPKISPLH